MEKAFLSLFYFICIPLLASSLSAQDESEPRTITVSGNAEREVAADRIRISVAIRSVREDLATARIASQECFEGIVAGLGELGIEPEKVELGNHSLGREYETGPQGQRTPGGFFSARDFMIELDDTSLFELVQGSLAEHPEVAVNHTRFSRQDEIEIRKELRSEALIAALEKAEAMAAVYLQKVGRPLKMNEGGRFGPGLFETRNVGTSMVVDGVGGRVALNALVEVTFELTD